MDTVRAGGGRTYLLALGFGSTVVMWAVGYIFRMPPAWMPGPLLVLLLLSCLVGAGWFAGRHTPDGWRAGAGVGLLSSVLNMLILGSLLTSGAAGSARPSAIAWIPGALVAGALLGAAGASLGVVMRRRAGDISEEWTPEGSAAALSWTAAFAKVGAGATFCLLVIGGMVTSRAAGLDVPDWPTSFGYNMFLYPLSRMSGGIYLEHSHRLFGSLVGLTTLVLAIHLQRADERRWVRFLSLGALLLVMVQGLLGGLRVTTADVQANAQVVTAMAETGRSLALRVVHGVTGQLFFSAMVALAAVTSATWKSVRQPTVGRSAPTDQRLTTILTGTIMVQLVLGAIQRHLAAGLHIHITVATVVLVLGIVVGARAAGLDHGQPLLRRLGKAVLWIVSAQVLLGICALVAKSMAGSQVPIPTYKVSVTTAHQALGAILLGTSMLLTAWSRRLLVGGEAAGPASTRS